MTNEEALEMAAELRYFCNEMDSCENCIFASPSYESDLYNCSLCGTTPLDWCLNKKEVEE